jgi:hypothetical protein
VNGKLKVTAATPKKLSRDCQAAVTLEGEREISLNTLSHVCCGRLLFFSSPTLRCRPVADRSLTFAARINATHVAGESASSLKLN